MGFVIAYSQGRHDDHTRHTASNPPRAVRAGSGLVSGGMGVLLFGFGLAAGVLAAHSAVGFLEDSAGPIIRVFLSAALVSSGIRNLQLLIYTGLDLDFAVLKGTDLTVVTAQQARLSYANFWGS
jgi:hypothetical protein